MKKLQFAMVGGGNGALIGDIHRIGAQFDDLAEGGLFLPPLG